MARSLRSLRQVATLRHGHMARRSAPIRFAPVFRALTANLTHLFSRNLKVQPIGIESAHQHEYYFYAI